MEQKPGLKTTEFWITIIGQLIPLLVMVGILTADEGSVLADAVSKAVAAVVALIAAVWPIVEYIKSRTAVKEAMLLGSQMVTNLAFERIDGDGLADEIADAVAARLR